MTEQDTLALAAKIGPILKEAFPEAHSITRLQVAEAIAGEIIPIRTENQKMLPEQAVIDALHISPKLSCDDRIAILREAQRLSRVVTEQAQ